MILFSSAGMISAGFASSSGIGTTAPPGDTSSVTATRWSRNWRRRAPIYSLRSVIPLSVQSLTYTCNIITTVGINWLVDLLPTPLHSPLYLQGWAQESILLDSGMDNFFFRCSTLINLFIFRLSMLFAPSTFLLVNLMLVCGLPIVVCMVLFSLKNVYMINFYLRHSIFNSSVALFLSVILVM